MLHYMTGNAQPLKFASCGKFMSNMPWQHPNRNLNTFVLLIGCEGTLYIEQDGHQYEMKKGNCVLLIPGKPHVGYRYCEPGVYYYWCHFFSRDNQIKLLEEDEMRQQVLLMNSNRFRGGFSDVFLLPEFGVINAEDRVSILFHQLLDFANSGCYTDYMKDYTLSLLAMEISRQCIEHTLKLTETGKTTDLRMAEIMEWIRMNCERKITTSEVATHFNYNPDYLSSVFKDVTGYPLLKYIQKIRISAAKNLLLHPNLTVREVAGMTGYDDEKHFMKVFKQFEGLTPSQYRNAFTQTHMNKR